MTPLNGVDAETLAYAQSKSEFSRARLKGFLETMMGLITGHNMHLLSFDEVVEKLRLRQAIYQGLQDIPLKNIAGSTGRYEDFTRHFLPRRGDERDKERWRNIYTLAVTGKGFPPIDVYKIDQVYFVKDGNHRVSVVRDLGWETIQAHVTELPSSISLSPDVEPDELLIKEECAYFLERTHLDKTRPASKAHLEVTAPGGYRRLLNHIELQRYLLERNRSRLNEDEAVSFQEAATTWFDQVYLPIVSVLKETGILNHFPGRSETDLYIWLVKHQAALRERHALGELDLPGELRFWLAYLDQTAVEPHLEDVDFPESVEAFLQSVEEESSAESPGKTKNAR